MEFRVNMTIEIERVGNALAIQTPVNLQLLYTNGDWYALCENPSFKTLPYDTMEEALIAAGKRITAPPPAESVEQPHIIGKITPD